MSGSSVGGEVDRLGAVAGLADDLDVGLLPEHHLQAAAEQRVVVDDEHADRLRGRSDRDGADARQLARSPAHLLGRPLDGAGPDVRHRCASSHVSASPTDVETGRIRAADRTAQTASRITP